MHSAGRNERDQSARRVIDEHNQRASWRAAFKPIVRTAVNLDQFTEPGAAVPNLKMRFSPRFFGRAASTRLNAPDRLPRDHNPVPFRQFF